MKLKLLLILATVDLVLLFTVIDIFRQYGLHAAVVFALTLILVEAISVVSVLVLIQDMARRCRDCRQLSEIVNDEGEESDAFGESF